MELVKKKSEVNLKVDIVTGRDKTVITSGGIRLSAEDLNKLTQRYPENKELRELKESVEKENE